MLRPLPDDGCIRRWFDQPGGVLKAGRLVANHTWHVEKNAWRWCLELTSMSGNCKDASCTCSAHERVRRDMECTSWAVRPCAVRRDFRGTAGRSATHRQGARAGLSSTQSLGREEGDAELSRSSRPT